MYIYLKQSLILMLIVSLIACGEDESTDDGESNAGTESSMMDNGHSDHSDHSDHSGHSESGDCESGNMLGDAALSGSHHSVNFEVVALSPDMLSNGLNQMTVKVTDDQGNAISIGALVLTPYMLEHGHGTSPADFTAEETEMGTYVFTDVNFIMPGAWELTFTWDTMEAKFNVCVS